jgi:hypothetical protein
MATLKHFATRPALLASIILLLAGHAAGAGASNRTSGLYTRKSVSIVPLVHDGVFSRSFAQPAYDSLIKGIEAGIHAEERYDLNTVPPARMAEVQNAGRTLRWPGDTTKIAELLKPIAAVVAAQVTDVDSINHRIRRNSREANPENIDIADASLRARMVESAYLGALLIDTLTQENISTKVLGQSIEKRTYTLRARMLWYYMSFVGSNGEYSNPTLVKFSEQTVSGIATGPTAMKEDAALEVVSSLVKSTVSSAFEASKNVPQFQVSGMVLSANDGVRISLGSKEGIKLDEGMDILETQGDHQVPVGFVRVDRVGDTRTKSNAVSEVYPIIGGGFDMGQVVRERYRAFDMRVMPKLELIKIPVHAALDVLQKDASSAIVVDLGAQINLAQLTGFNVKQLFFVVNGFYGMPSVLPVEGSKVGTSIMGASAGLLKKFWLSRLNVQVGVEGAYESFKLQRTDLSEEVSLKFNTIGLRLAGGVEYAFTPDLMIGVIAQYKLMPSPATATYTSGSRSEEYLAGGTVWDSYGWSDIKLGGLGFGATVSYSIPFTGF